MTPWPRKLINFPIVLIATTLHVVAGISLLWQSDAHFTTSIDLLYLILPNDTVLASVLFISATMASMAFLMKRKTDTVLLMVPQQLLLYLCAGAAFHAILIGQFADGIQRSQAFLLTDQAPVILIAIFHSWAMTLILLYGEEVK